jgi:hypothetical protein
LANLVLTEILQRYYTTLKKWETNQKLK